jgi:hypothetical protein
MQVTHVRSPGAIMSVAREVLICSGSFLGNVRVMMSAVHAAVWACCLPMEWIGTPPVSGMDRRHALPSINTEAA